MNLMYSSNAYQTRAYALFRFPLLNVFNLNNYYLCKILSKTYEIIKRIIHLT